MSEVTIQIVGLARGGASPYDDQYVVAYDADAEGEPILETSPLVADARVFADASEARDYWMQTRGTTPRADGKPDRPLTAFSVVISPVQRIL